MQVGALLAWKGTVTRTTEVRPELYLATFKCKDCGERARNVEQQFVLTYPMMCPAAACGNKSHWQLIKEESKFVDWQRAKVQENSDEVRARMRACVRACVRAQHPNPCLRARARGVYSHDRSEPDERARVDAGCAHAQMPAGSLPRSLDVIIRGEMVEAVRPGDKVVFTGCLIVVPDMGAFSAPGEKTLLQSKGTSGNAAATGRGVTGVRATGARELHHKLAFLANNVQVRAPAATRTERCVTAHSVQSHQLDTALGLKAPQEGERCLRHVRASTHLHAAVQSAPALRVGVSRSRALSASSSGRVQLHDQKQAMVDARTDPETTPEEVEASFPREVTAALQRMGKRPDIYHALARCVAPGVYGHEDVKKAVLLMLVGGVNKTTAEGIRLRGDINVAIVGDPSTAKSQARRPLKQPCV